MLESATLTISTDEMAWALVERNLRVNPNKNKEDSRYGLHRWQIIYVIRNEQLRSFWKDLGPVDRWPGTDQVRIMGFGTMTVGELMDCAEHCRYLKRLVPEEMYEGRPNLVQEYWDWVDQQIHTIPTHRSLFGPDPSKKIIRGAAR